MVCPPQILHFPSFPVHLFLRNQDYLFIIPKKDQAVLYQPSVEVLLLITKKIDLDFF